MIKKLKKKNENLGIDEHFNYLKKCKELEDELRKSINKVEKGKYHPQVNTTRESGHDFTEVDSNEITEIGKKVQEWLHPQTKRSSKIDTAINMIGDGLNKQKTKRTGTGLMEMLNGETKSKDKQIEKITEYGEKKSPLPQRKPGFAKDKSEPIKKKTKLSKKKPDPEKLPVVFAKLPKVFAKEPVVSAKEPVVLVKEPVVMTKEPVVFAKEPVVLAKKPVVSAKEHIVSIKELIHRPKSQPIGSVKELPKAPESNEQSKEKVEKKRVRRLVFKEMIKDEKSIELLPAVTVVKAEQQKDNPESVNPADGEVPEEAAQRDAERVKRIMAKERKMKLRKERLEWEKDNELRERPKKPKAEINGMFYIPIPENQRQPEDMNSNYIKYINGFEKKFRDKLFEKLSKSNTNDSFYTEVLNGLKDNVVKKTTIKDTYHSILESLGRK